MWSFEQRNFFLWAQAGGFPITGHSDWHLARLLQQFTNCLKTSDHRVRIVRANRTWTGVNFLDDLDADIWFGYGMFHRNAGATISPICGGWGLHSRMLPQLAERGRKDVMVRLRAAIAAVK